MLQPLVSGLESYQMGNLDKQLPNIECYTGEEGSATLLIINSTIARNRHEPLAWQGYQR